MGNINENTPDGSTTFQQTGTQKVYDPNNKTWMDVPTFTRTTTLAPEQQAVADQNNRANLNLATTAANQAGFLQNYLSQPVQQGSLGPRPNAPQLNTSGGSLPFMDANVGNGPGLATWLGSNPELVTSLGAQPSLTTRLGNQPQLRQSYDTEFTSDRARTEDALFSRLNPQIERDREALASRLANQGIRAGSAAYDREMNNFGQSVNDARMQAILASGQEQSRLADLARQSAGFSNDAAQQAFANSAQQAAFENQANQQSFQNRAQDAAFANAARQQAFENQARNIEFGNAANQQMFQNRLQGTAFGNDARQQAFANEMQRSQFANQSLIDQYNATSADRAQALQEQFAYRNQPINEISALLAGTQVNQPQFMGANIPRIPTTDHAGIIQQDFNNRMGIWQQKTQQQQSLMGGLLGFGGALLGLSDERAKEDIEKVGKLDGHNLYRYSYKDDPTKTKHVGVMAQEVEKKRPDAVLRREDGMRVVDYGGLFGKKER